MLELTINPFFDQTIQTIQNLDNIVLTRDQIIPLNNGFKLHTFYPQGYAITFFNHLVEYDLSVVLKISPNSHLHYFGPLALYQKSNSEWIPVNKDILPPENESNQWIGIDSRFFQPYQNWINRNGTCGMMSAAVMLAYYQDHLDETLLSPNIRTKNGHEEMLYHALLKSTPTVLFNGGTIAYQVSYGINRFLRKYQPINTLFQTRAKATISPTFGIVKTRCESTTPTPTIIGLVTFLNSPNNYQNHWVVAYSYQENNDGRFYRVHDNHGQYQAVINVKWTLSTVKINRKQKQL